MKVYPNHDEEVPPQIGSIVWNKDGIFHIELKDGQGRLISDELAEKLYAATIRPMSFMYLPEQRSWKQREAEAIYARALRRRIPRELRAHVWGVRRWLAAKLYPDNFYDEDD